MNKIDQHKASIQLALCQRDYELMVEHHPDLLDVIEKAISDKVTPDQVKRWAMATVGEAALVQRVFNAARYAMEVANS